MFFKIVAMSSSTGTEQSVSTENTGSPVGESHRITEVEYTETDYKLFTLISCRADTNTIEQQIRAGANVDTRRGDEI